MLAVSGGPDSLALCDVLAQLREELRLELLVASVDHGLRPEAREEVFKVGTFCEELGLPFRQVVVTVESEGGLQAAARRARYAALRRLAAGEFGPGALIATGHHRDDRAETVLLRLLRGTSLEGLHVLPARQGDLLRPMIRASREDVLMHCKRRGLTPVADPSNDNRNFLRVRVRQELIPLLEDMAPGIVASLNSLADEAGRLDEPLGLNREQRRQLRRALADRRSAIDLPLPSGLRLLRSTHPDSGEE